MNIKKLCKLLRSALGSFKANLLLKLLISRSPRAFLFIKDEKGVIAIMSAISLPLLFGVMALAFDLSNGMRDKLKLGDALKEASLIASAVRDHTIVTQKTENLARLYLGENVALSAISIDYGKQNLDANEMSDFQKTLTPGSTPALFSNYATVSASLDSKSIFANLLDKSLTLGFKVGNNLKVEKLDNEAVGDYVFAMSFVRDSGNNANLPKEIYEQLCQADANLINNGLCNPPLGSARVIDATQSMVASFIKAVIGVDTDNKSQFGFLPWMGATQIKGEDLPKDARVGPDEPIYPDGTYIMYPIILKDDKRIKYANYWSKFFTEITGNAKDSLLNGPSFSRSDGVIPAKTKAGASDIRDTMIFDSFLALQKLDMPTKASLATKAQGGELQQEYNAAKKILQASAVAGSGVFRYDDIDVASNIRHLFDEKEFIYFRLYDNKRDSIKLPKGYEATLQDINNGNTSRLSAELSQKQEEIRSKKAVVARFKTIPNGGEFLKDIIRTNEAEIARTEQEVSNLQTQIAAAGDGIQMELKGKPLCNAYVFNSPGGACQTTLANQLKFHEKFLAPIRHESEIRNIKSLNEVPFEMERGTYKVTVGSEQNRPVYALIRAANMLAKSRSGNTKQKIIIFTDSEANTEEYLKQDREFFQAGLCDSIRNGLKSKLGVDVEIYPISLNLNSQNGNGAQAIEAFKRNWELCTPKENIFSGDEVDKIMKLAKEKILKDSFGKFSNL